MLSSALSPGTFPSRLPRGAGVCAAVPKAHRVELQLESGAHHIHHAAARVRRGGLGVARKSHPTAFLSALIEAKLLRCAHFSRQPGPFAFTFSLLYTSLFKKYRVLRNLKCRSKIKLSLKKAQCVGCIPFSGASRVKRAASIGLIQSSKFSFFSGELVPLVIEAWNALPDVKILQALEIRKDFAAEAIVDGGWCNCEGKRRGGAKRVHVGASYAQLRARLGV